MKFGNILTKGMLGLTVIAAVAIPDLAQATTIDGVVFSPGDVFIVGTVYEGVVTNSNPDAAGNYSAPITAAGQQLGGVGIVNAIENAQGQIVWQNGDNDTSLTFTFSQYISQAPTGTGTASNPFAVNFTGGVVNFFTGSSTSGFSASNVATAFADVGTTPFLNLVGASTGVSCGSTDCTLESTISQGNLTDISSADGNGNFDVGSGTGAADAAFAANSIALTNSSGQPIAVNLTLTSAFNSITGTGFAVSGEIGLKDETVPEPASLALIGLGMFALAFVKRLN